MKVIEIEVMGVVLPEFDANGNLPVGVYTPEFSEFESRFCTSRTDSSSRPRIMRNYKTFCRMLIESHITLSQWADGGYISSKQEPHDIDMVLLYEGMIYITNIDNWIYFKNNIYGNGEQHRHAHLDCHTIYIPVYPEDNPKNTVTVTNSNYWKKWFTKDRQGNPKGIVDFDVKSEDFINGITGGNA